MDTGAFKAHVRDKLAEAAPLARITCFDIDMVRAHSLASIAGGPIISYPQSARDFLASAGTCCNWGASAC